MRDIKTIEQQDQITVDHKLQTYKVGRYKLSGYAERDLYVYRLTVTTTKNGEKSRKVTEGFCWPIAIREFRRGYTLHSAWEFHAESKKTRRFLKSPFHAIAVQKGSWKRRVKIKTWPFRAR